MTDLTPNDLSHFSDEEFNALCPQGYHAPGPELLSPAAQAISDAYQDNLSSYVETGLIAALRAAADQLDHADSAHTLYAIATELEGQQ